MAPTIGRVALDNGFHGSIPGDWVAPPPQNIHHMFIKIVPNSKGKKGTYFCYLVESYRENGRIKHRTLRSFGLLEEDQVPFLKAMYAKKKPRLVYDDETM